MLARLPPSYPSKMKRSTRIQSGAGLREDMQANWIKAKKAAKKYVYDRLLDLAVKMQPEESPAVSDSAVSVPSPVLSVPSPVLSVPSPVLSVPDFDIKVTEPKTKSETKFSLPDFDLPIAEAETKPETPIAKPETPIAKTETLIAEAKPETPIAEAKPETPIAEANKVFEIETVITPKRNDALRTSEIPLGELLKRETVAMKQPQIGGANGISITKATLERCLGMIDECIKNL